MIILIVADKKEVRHDFFATLSETLEDSELIYLDDTSATLPDLEQYLYPSLFTLTPPIIRARFILSGGVEEATVDRIKKMQASPTIFVFEELAVAAPIKTLLKKHGAAIHTVEKEKSAPKENTLFEVTKAITGPDKKARWFAYREALAAHSIEALMGILYWKVRELAAKEKDGGPYRNLYRELLSAHAKAWKTGAPLELLIEKVILSQ